MHQVIDRHPINRKSQFSAYFSTISTQVLAQSEKFFVGNFEVRGNILRLDIVGCTDFARYSIMGNT